MKPDLLTISIMTCITLLYIVFVNGAANAQENTALENTAQELVSTIANDFKLPVTATSKQQSLDGKKKTSIFIENVVIRQGSLEILADRVEANATSGQGKEVIIAIGKPASYSQRLEDGSLVSASANEIIYTVESQTISLKGNAAIVQNEVTVSGDSIAFDMSKEQIMASSDANSDTSVTTVLSPGAFTTTEQDNEPSTKNEP